MNYVLNLSFWLWWAVVLFIIVPIGLWIVKDIVDTARDDSADEDDWKRVSFIILIKAIVLFVSIAALTVAFGPGEPVNIPSPENTGSFQMNQEVSSPDTPEVIEEKAEQKKNKFLKEVESEKSLPKMTEEADDYINKALKRSKDEEK